MRVSKELNEYKTSDIYEPEKPHLNFFNSDRKNKEIVKVIKTRNMTSSKKS
jgi:lipopolysaccharide export system protein LptC